MSLLTPGYFPNTIFPEDYWADDYWQAHTALPEGGLAPISIRITPTVGTPILKQIHALAPISISTTPLIGVVRLNWTRPSTSIDRTYSISLENRINKILYEHRKLKVN